MLRQFQLVLLLLVYRTLSTPLGGGAAGGKTGVRGGFYTGSTAGGAYRASSNDNTTIKNTCTHDTSYELTLFSANPRMNFTCEEGGYVIECMSV